MKIKDKFIRGAVGGTVTALTAMAMQGITSTDDYREWRKKNMWAGKYLDLITPEVLIAVMAQKNKQLGSYFENLFNSNSRFDKSTQAIKAAESLFKDNSGTASGKIGELVGGIFGAPEPWRLIRDGQQLWVGATGGEPYKISNVPSQSFMEGYLKGGMLDYMGFDSNSPFAEFQESVKSTPEYKFLDKIEYKPRYTAPKDEDAIKTKDGKGRKLTPQEETFYQIRVISLYTDLLKKNYEQISNIKLQEGEEETVKQQKELVSKLLSVAKETALNEIQAKTGFAPSKSEVNMNKKLKNTLINLQLLPQVQLKGIDSTLLPQEETSEETETP